MSPRRGLPTPHRRPSRAALADLPPEVRQLVMAARRRRGSSFGSVSRRSVLAGSGAVALGACGIGDDGAQPDGDGTTDPLRSTIVEDRSDEEARVRFGNWDAYIDRDDDDNIPTIVQFTEDTGIEVEYSVAVDDNESFYSEVRPLLDARQDIGYDIISSTGWATARYIRNGYAQELDEANIPNKSNILQTLQNVDFDPGRVFSMPWQGGYAGFAWNTREVPDGVRTLDDLLRPELAGRVVVLSEMRDTVGIIMMAQGVDIESADWGDEEFEAAIAVIEEGLASGQIRQVRGNSYLEDLESDDALACIGWSGDISSLNFEAGDDARWEWAMPEAGGTLWFDDLLVPITSEFKTNAERLMNHYLDPEIAAQVAEWVQFITPVEGAQEAMRQRDPALAEDPLIFPTEEFLEQTSVFRTLSADEEDRYSALFQEAIGN